MNTYSRKDFVNACSTGQLETAQCILQNNPTNDFYYKFQLAFNNSCINGHLNVAQWLLTLENNMIDVSFGQNYNFKWACGYGHLVVSQWLYDIVSQTLSDSEKHDLCKQAFEYSCGNGHLDVSQWLFTMFDSPVCWISDDIFRSNCIQCNVKVVEWLCSCMPFKYSIQLRTYSSGCSVVIFRINPDKEIKLTMLIYLLKKSNNINYLTANILYDLQEML